MSSDSPSPDSADNNPALRARVPDHVAGGCFSTGAIVMTGQSEFIVDFLQTIGRPHRVAARVIIPHPVMPQFVDALQKNLDIYRSRFGDPPSPQAQQNPDARRPTPQEIYDDLKLPDEVLSGTYANGVMIGHGATEFGMDFLTSFFPQSAVSSRVFLAAGQVPRLLESLKGAVRQLQERARGPQPDPGAIPDGTGITDVGPPTLPPGVDLGGGPGEHGPHDQEALDQEPRDQEPRDQEPPSDLPDGGPPSEPDGSGEDHPNA